MGRKKIEIDLKAIRMLASRGMTQVEIAKELGVSHVTLAKRIGELRLKEGPLKEYRCLLGLQLTDLQCRSLEALTPEKLEDASLIQLARAFSILKKVELIMEGKPTKITGLLAYVLEMEKKEDKLPYRKDTVS